MGNKSSIKLILTISLGLFATFQQSWGTLHEPRSVIGRLAGPYAQKQERGTKLWNRFGLTGLKSLTIELSPNDVNPGFYEDIGNFAEYQIVWVPFIQYRDAFGMKVNKKRLARYGLACCGRNKLAISSVFLNTKLFKVPDATSTAKRPVNPDKIRLNISAKDMAFLYGQIDHANSTPSNEWTENIADLKMLVCLKENSGNRIARCTYHSLQRAYSLAMRSHRSTIRGAIDKSHDRESATYSIRFETR